MSDSNHLDVTHLDATADDTLACEIADEALEAAAADRPNSTKGQTDWPYHNIYCC